jgi:hypothetical protein
VGLRTGGKPAAHSRSPLESGTRGGKSPVDEMRERPAGIQSTAGHVESRGKQGGPPSKAKYYLVTDSA